MAQKRSHRHRRDESDACVCVEYAWISEREKYVRRRDCTIDLGAVSRSTRWQQVVVAARASTLLSQPRRCDNVEIGANESKKSK